MDLDLELLHQEILAMYRAEHAALTPRVTLEMLEHARNLEACPYPGFWWGAGILACRCPGLRSPGRCRGSRLPGQRCRTGAGR